MNIVDYIKKISCDEAWKIAYRKRSGKLLYQGNAKDFIIIPNSIRFWRADPFVIKYKEESFLFAEMYDRIKQRGVIGAARIKNGKVGKFKTCLKLPFHLSYPLIYEKNNELFMIPECNQSGVISAYVCELFPYKWRKCNEILNISAVDTTPVRFEENDSFSYFTSIVDKSFTGNDNLHIIDPEGNIKAAVLNDYNVRSAGNVFFDQDILIRPSQDDSENNYGGGVFFNAIDCIENDSYSEHTILKVVPPGHISKEREIAIELIGDYCRDHFIGVHTYNFNDEYEVVDLLVDNEQNMITLFRNQSKLWVYIGQKIKRKILHFTKSKEGKR